MSRAERHLFVMFRLETYCELYVRKVLLVQRESVLLQLFLPEVRPMGSVRFALKRCQRSARQSRAGARKGDAARAASPFFCPVSEASSS